MEAFDPDELVWAVDAAADELRGARQAERVERRRVERSLLSVQPSLDGGLRLYSELDAVTGAPVLNALDAAAGPPTPADTAGPDPDVPAGPPGLTRPGEAVSRWSPTSRSRQYAVALAGIAADWLGGAPGRPARPLLIAHVDVRDVSTAAAGTVALHVRGPLPRLTARIVDQLAVDADLRTVLFDGARPLAVSAELAARAVPAKTRIAVAARDRGCRSPGSRDPAGHTDVHHTTPRGDGGDHHPDNLVALSRRHTLTHRHGWQLTLNPDDGEVTATRGHRRWRSLPHGTPLTTGDDSGHPPES